MTASAVRTENPSKVISSVGSGTVWKWSKTQIDSKPSASACTASSTVRAQASAAGQPSYSPFHPWGTSNPTCIRSSTVVGLSSSYGARWDGGTLAGRPSHAMGRPTPSEATAPMLGR